MIRNKWSKINIRQVIAFIMLVCILGTNVNLTFAKASILGSGNLNSAGSITWNLNSDGVLTIDGSGTPDSFSSASQLPWDAMRESIRKVQFDKNTKGIKNMSYWFQGCRNLEYINMFPANVENLKYSFADCISIETFPTIPMSVTKMQGTFQGCSSLVQIPEFYYYGVENFSYTFRNCKSLTFVYMNLPYPVTTIKRMFSGCRNMDALIVFNGCTRLVESECANAFTEAATYEGRKIRIVSSNMSIESVRSRLNIEAPNIEYCGSVSSTTDYNYFSKKNCAFAYIKSTGSVYICGNDKLETADVYNYMLPNCNSIKKVEFGYGIKSLMSSGLENYKALETVVLPDSLTEIPVRFFSGCEALTNIVLPSNLLKINIEAFKGCTSLKYLYLPDSIKEVDSSAFAGTTEGFYLEFSKDNEIAKDIAINIGYEYKVPESINITYYGNVTEGCRLENSGFKEIYLKYSNGEKVNIPLEQIVISEYEIEAGENEITASYGDFSTTFNVTGIEKSVINITAEYDNTISERSVEGGTIDTDALTVCAEYNNGTKEYLEYGGITGEEGSLTSRGYYTIDRYNLQISRDGMLNCITIRVSVTSSSAVAKTTSVYVPADKKSVIGITAYYIGSPITEGMGINPENIVAYANYNNGSKERILFNGTYNTYGKDIDINYYITDETKDIKEIFNISDEYQFSIDAYVIKNQNNLITLWCNNQSVTISVEGKKKEQIGISATYSEEAIEDGDINIDNLKVYATYDNGDEELLEDMNNISVQNNYKLMVGENYLEICYTDPSTGKKSKCVVKVMAREMKPVEIKAILPVKKEIVEGEWLKDVEWNITTKYDNGKCYDSVSTLDIKGCAVEGENVIEVNYLGVDYELVFNGVVFVPSIITTEGEEPPATLDKSNNIKLTISGNSELAVTNKEVVWSSSNEEVIKVSNTGMVTAVNYGNAKVVAQINGRIAESEIEVPRPPISSISANYDGEVLEDTQLELDKLSVLLTLENDDVLELGNKNGIFFERDYSIIAGENEIELYYIEPETAKKYTCMLKVAGKEKTPVEIKSIKVNRDDIFEGEPLYSIEYDAVVLYDNGKIYDAVINCDEKGFVKKGINSIEVNLKGVKANVEFEGKEFIPKIIMSNGRAVPESVLLDDRLELALTSNCQAALENKQIEWRSSDKNVMTVDEYGRVTIIAPGTSDITAEVNNESVKVTIAVVVPSKDLKISNDYLTMAIGDEIRLEYAITPENSTDKISFNTDSEKVAIVDEFGNVQAVGEGTAIISATTENGISANAAIIVKSPVKSIKLNLSEKYMIIGTTTQLKYEIAENEYDKSIKWSSANKSIATVSSKGKVTPKSVGNTTIKIKASNGTYAKCKVYVRKNPTKITLSKKSVTSKIGKTFTLKYTIPANTYVSKVVWSSSNKKVATVSSKGKVKCKKTGTTYIKIKANNGVVAKCKVTVKNKK